METASPLQPRPVARVETRYRRIVTELPAPASIPVLEKLEKHELRAMGGQPLVVWDRAEGFQVYDASGNCWLDFSSGVLITNAGHGRQEIVDAIKAQVELSKALNMLITVQQEKETAAARLNALRNKPPETALAEPAEAAVKPETADFKALEGKAVAANPELAALAARLKASEKRLSLARAEYAPDFMLSWRRRSSDDAAMNGTYDVSLGLTVPLWFTRNKAMVGEAKAERDMAAAEYDAGRNMLLLELKEASVKLNYYARLVELYSGTVLPQAEQSLKAAEAGYQAGKTDFLDLVDADRTLLETRREFYEYSAGYAGWLGRVKALTGEGL